MIKAPKYVKELYDVFKAYTANDDETVYSFITEHGGMIIETWRTMYQVYIIVSENPRIKNDSFMSRLSDFEEEIECLSEDDPEEEKLIRKEVKKFISFLEENYRGLV